MGYCLSCGKLRELVNGKCRQCNEDNLMRKHPGWARQKDIERERKRQAEREALI